MRLGSAVKLIAVMAMMSAANTAKAQIPDVVGKVAYRFDLAANECGVRQTPAFEEWSLRALNLSQDRYYKGYQDGASAYDPEFKQLGADKWCEKHLPLLRKMHPTFLK